jgi:ankyrin repeat protein
MGGAASISTAVAPLAHSFPLKRLPELVETAIYQHEKFCLCLDPDELASRYLKYQLGSFVSCDDIQNFNTSYLNRALVGAMRYGRTLTLKFPTLENVSLETVFAPRLFPVELLERQVFFRDDVWQSVLKPELGDPPAEEITISSDFVFIICVTQSSVVPPELTHLMHVFQIADCPRPDDAAGGSGGSGDVMESVAQMLGAGEIVRNSPQLVEAAFDGDLEEVKSWLEKGYHFESTDGRKHTALSEAACQGHELVVKYLLDLGADPNALNDTNRSPLWRAAFSGHVGTCDLLLRAGSDKDIRDKISMESAFDVAKTDEVRSLLSSWDQAKTEQLMAARKRLILQKIEERIQTSQQREEYARQKIRMELVAKAEAGDVDGVKEVLLMIAEEAEKQGGGRPRASAESRNDTGQSLLSIAAQHDHVDLAHFLCTHWKECDKHRWDLAEGELSVEAKVFKTNVNARDLKGWNCTCIAVFHSSLKVLKILLENGGDCNQRSQYNKNAHDLAKDELDAALNVVTSRAEIRDVIIQYDTSGSKAAAIFGSARAAGELKREVDLYRDLGDSGSAVVMQLELQKEAALQQKDAAAANAKKVGKGGGGGKGKAGGGGKKK